MFEFEAKIRYSEVDSDGKLSLLGLLNYFQDCSTFQSEELGVGIEYLKEKGLLWALSAWQIVVKRYPKLCEKVTVGTAPYEFRGFIGNRNFWMKDANGELIAWANSVWSLISIKEGLPVKCPADMQDVYELSDKLPMDYAPRHIRFEGDGVHKDTVEVVKHFRRNWSCRKHFPYKSTIWIPTIMSTTDNLSILRWIFCRWISKCGSCAWNTRCRRISVHFFIPRFIHPKIK